MEAQRMREIIPNEEIQKILNTDHIMEVCIITDAHDIISTLKNCVRTVYYENKQKSIQLKSATRILHELLDSRRLILDTYKDVLNEKIFCQETLVKTYQDLKIEDKLVLKEIQNCQDKQYKILNAKIDPILVDMNEKISKLMPEDIPILTNDEIRLNKFIEEIQVEENNLKQYFNDSNLVDYIKMLPESFNTIVESLRELKSYLYDPSIDSKNTSQLRRILEKGSLGNKKEKRTHSKGNGISHKKVPKRNMNSALSSSVN